MRVCLAPLGSLSLAVADALLPLGHEAYILDSFGRCSGILSSLALPEKLRLVDAPPGSKPLTRILRRCDAFILAWDPWDAGACGGWEQVILGYALEALNSSVERIVATLPAGAYAWSGESVECGVLPRLPPPSLVYSAPLSAVTLLAARRDSLLVVVHPPLVHLESVTVKGSPEPINWFERLVSTRVLEARREARLTILDYRDAGESIALYAEGESLGFVCLGGFTLEASLVAERLGYEAVSPRLPDTIVVEGGGVKRRTSLILERLGLKDVHR